jgi:dTDP-glucose pyrophosphorylase
MECIDRNSRGIVLVCDHERRLLGTVTDGDIRRAMLVGENLDATITRLLDLKKQSGRPGPVVAGVDSNPSTLLQIMQEKMVRQIPLLDADGKVEDLVTLEELLPDGHLPLQAMIMAGGFGKRLRPLTEHLPKPMLPIGDRPLIERIVQQLQQAGIHRVNLATHYKGEVIEDHLGDGSEFGVEINYVREDEPLGTAGALCLLEESDQPLLVINGDILTGLDFRAMLDFHWEHDAAMTVAVREHDFHLPYGVVDTRGVEILGIKEKPVVKHFVNAGIYLLDSRVCRLIPPGRAYDIPDLIEQLINENQRVVSFLIREYWQDIGEIGDYEKAMADFSNNEV